MKISMNGFLRIWSSIFHIEKKEIEIISNNQNLFGEPKEGNFYRAFETEVDLRKAIVLVSRSCTNSHQALVKICRDIGPCYVKTKDDKVSFHFTDKKIVETF